MVYVKSLLFGIGGAVLASILWVLVAFVFPLFGPMLIGRLRGTGGASAGAIAIRYRCPKRPEQLHKDYVLLSPTPNSTLWTVPASRPCSSQ